VAFSTARESNEYTLRWWTRTYPEEPFFLSETAEKKASVVEETTTLRGFDLLASASRQADLLWQVSSPELGTKSSLEKAVQEYHKFLRLKKTMMNRTSSSRFPLIPTMAIDLVWHTHLTASLALYQKDCLTICGSPMDHDDTFTDRSAGGESDVSFQKTAKLWNDVYGEADYLSKGGYRGEPPADYYFVSSLGTTQEATTTARNSTISPNSLDDSMERGVLPLSVFPQKKDSKQPGTSSVGLCSRLSSAKAKGIFFLLLLISTLVRLVTNGALSPESDDGYTCGAMPPSTEEIASRDIPTCLSIYKGQERIGDRNLCLRAAERDDDPPVYCYEKIPNSGISIRMGYGGPSPFGAWT
jgi:hypothetical protein